MKNIIIIIILFVATLFFAYILQNQPENVNKQMNELLYFPSGTFIKEVSLDYKTTVTNMMWLQVIQYYGEHILTDKNLYQLYNLFNIITDLDPNLMQCYVFGGTIITYDQKRPDLGFEILKKGMSNLPESWEIPFITGFLNYVYSRNYSAAYRWFIFASTKPNSPYYCKTFAAAAIKKEKDYITALKLWKQIYDNSKNRLERENAIKSMIMIISYDFNENLNEEGNQNISSYINQELKKMDFLPFSVNIKVQYDTVIVEQQ